MATPKKPTVKKTARPGPKRAPRAAKAKAGSGGKTLLVGAGIGSAAIVAALLFASRANKAKKKPDAPTE